MASCRGSACVYGAMSASAGAPAVGGRRKSASRNAAAAVPPAGVCPVLARFEVAWAELAATLPACSRVRMEGVDPAALPARQAAWLAVGYPLKWATATYACPTEVRRSPARQFRTASARTASPSAAVQRARTRARLLRAAVPCCQCVRECGADAQPIFRRLQRTLHSTRRPCARFLAPPPRLEAQPVRSLPRCGSAWSATACGCATAGQASYRTARALRWSLATL